MDKDNKTGNFWQQNKTSRLVLLEIEKHLKIVNASELVQRTNDS